MQRVKNNGSFLQSYALYTVLKEVTNENIEFIDFANPLLDKKKNTKRTVIKETLRKAKHLILPKYWNYLKVVKNIEKFTNEWETWLALLGVDKNKYNFAGDKKYNLMVIGSDEVFNICQFSDEHADIPWELLGEGIDAKKNISYAASCGQTDIESINKIGETERCSELLNRFSAISVRDENTYNVVKALSKVQPQYHIDPVLLLADFPKDPNYKRLPYKYVLIYAYTGRIGDTKEIKAIKKFAKERKLKIVCVNCFQTWCDKMIVSSAFALLQHVKDAECVITDTFHGTVFSIRNNVPFVTITRNSNTNKLRFLLKQFGLENREIKNIDAIGQLFENTIDFDAVNRLLKKERTRSIEYLTEQVKSAESLNE